VLRALLGKKVNEPFFKGMHMTLIIAFSEDLVKVSASQDNIARGKAEY
jgi:hypothetical protein